MFKVFWFKQSVTSYEPGPLIFYFKLTKIKEKQKLSFKIIKNSLWNTCKAKQSQKRLLQGCHTLRDFREFSDCRKSQGNSGKFIIVENIRKV